MPEGNRAHHGKASYDSADLEQKIHSNRNRGGTRAIDHFWLLVALHMRAGDKSLLVQSRLPLLGQDRNAHHELRVIVTRVVRPQNAVAPRLDPR